MKKITGKEKQQFEEHLFRVLNSLIVSAKNNEKDEMKKYIKRAKNVSKQLGRYEESISELEKLHTAIAVEEKAICLRNLVKSNIVKERKIKYVTWPDHEKNYRQGQSMC